MTSREGHRPPRLVTFFFLPGTSDTSLGNYGVDRAKFGARALPVPRALQPPFLCAGGYFPFRVVSEERGRTTATGVEMLSRIILNDRTL